jgi:predicted DNA binding CopG/RHH family protein
MDRLSYKGKIFTLCEYSKESDFELDIIKHAKEIFGPKSLYIDIKKRIKKDSIITIPDGYLLDFSFETDPRLYIIENELVTHDPYKHIGEQLLKFAISYKASGLRIKKFLVNKICEDSKMKKEVESGFSKAGYGNIDAFLEDLIFEKEVSAIIIIDEITPDLENVVNQLAMKIDLLEFQTFISSDERIRKFTPFQEEIRDITEGKDKETKVQELDTIVVPANEEGFNEVFLGKNQWYAIRVSSSMIDRIKYIAGYQTTPISAITHYAEVSKIEKYKDTGKYIVYFKDSAKDIGPIKLTIGKRGKVPQAPRYTTYEKLIKAKKLEDIF